MQETVTTMQWWRLEHSSSCFKQLRFSLLKRPWNRPTTLHTRTILSSLADTSFVPSGENLADPTPRDTVLKRYRVAAGIDQPLRDPSPYATPLPTRPQVEIQRALSGMANRFAL